MQTILIPMVQNADETAQAMAAAENPPREMRGVSGTTRATRFGNIAGYHKAARQEIAVLVQVVTLEAVDQIEAIAAVPEVHGIFIGPSDQAAALSYVGELSYPQFQKVATEATHRIVTAGKPPGFLSADKAFADTVTEAGATFVARDVDMAALKSRL